MGQNMPPNVSEEQELKGDERTFVDNWSDNTDKIVQTMLQAGLQGKGYDIEKDQSLKIETYKFEDKVLTLYKTDDEEEDKLMYVLNTKTNTYIANAKMKTKDAGSKRESNNIFTTI